MKSFLPICMISALAMLLCASTAYAGNPQRGLEISVVCQSCHGKAGNEALQPDYPILAGQHEDYLVYALESYRDGRRVNALMNGFAMNLSDQDIEDLAAWYSSQEGLYDIEVK